MARPAPTTKSNFIQTALIMITVMLGFQLFFGPKGNGTTTYDSKPLKTRADVLTAMRDANKKVLDIQIAQTLSHSYSNLLDEDFKKKEITADQKQELEIEAAVLVADTQLKGGLKKDESTRVRAAYQTLAPLERKLSKTPVWNKDFPVASNDQVSITSISGHALHEKIVETLSQRNQHDLIWGAIPGGYQFIDFLVHMTGANPSFSYAFAAFLLALCVRAIVFPLSQKQLMFGRQMSQLVPRVNEIKDKYKSDPQEQNLKVMELYREYGINPMAGCLPAMVQMPLFLTVYQCMLLYQFTFQKGTFLWISENTSAASHGFIGRNLGQNDYILVVLYGISMVVSTLLTPVSDPTQGKQQRMLGVGVAIVFTVMMLLGPIPVVSGFVLYWTFTNLLATAQSIRAYRMPLPPLVKVNAPGGGVYPTGNKPQGRWAKMMDDMQKMQEQSMRDQQEKAKQSKGEDSKGELNGKVNQTNTETKPNNAAKHKPKKRK